MDAIVDYKKNNHSLCKNLAIFEQIFLPSNSLEA